MDELKVIYLPLSELTPDDKNAKLHPAEQVEQIKKSIKTFKMCDPIGIAGDENLIIEGHGRYMALQELGVKEAPCIRLDHLDTDEKRKAYALIHNKTTMNSGFDIELLDMNLAEIETIDMGLYGFETITDEKQEAAQEDNYDAEPPAEPKAKYGEIYQLGRHRLMCGDATKTDDVEKLMDGRKADMVFTDPPYNIGYQGVNDKRTIKNDKMDDSDFLDFLEKSLMVCDTAYVCCSWQYSHLFKKAMTDLGMPPKAMIVWNKVNPAQHLDKYFKQHEIIFYFGKFGGEKTIRGDVWEVKRQTNTIHPTMKPIELIAMALQDNPQKTSVYDGFGGSGSTLIACEQTNKDCFMMEIDPKYIDVIINRWETFTGEKAVKIN